MTTTHSSRRHFLTRASAGLVAASLWPGHAAAEEAAGENGDFDFIAVNDLHFTDPKKCPPWFNEVFAAMKASAPKAEFVLVGGDLTSECTETEFGMVREMLGAIGLPVHVTLGNHDVTEKGERTAYDKFFPGKRNYIVEHRGWQIVSADSVQDRGYENTKIPEGTLQWLGQALARIDRRKPLIVSTHFPLGAGMIRRPKNADDFLDCFRKHNVRAIFNGHWHGFGQMMFKDAIVSTDRCCSRYRSNHDGSKKKGWYVCEARQGTITRRFVPVPEPLIAQSEWH